jgi:hypothetical protein
VSVAARVAAVGLSLLLVQAVAPPPETHANHVSMTTVMLKDRRTSSNASGAVNSRKTQAHAKAAPSEAGPAMPGDIPEPVDVPPSHHPIATAKHAQSRQDVSHKAFARNGGSLRLPLPDFRIVAALIVAFLLGLLVGLRIDPWRRAGSKYNQTSAAAPNKKDDMKQPDPHSELDREAASGQAFSLSAPGWITPVAEPTAPPARRVVDYRGAIDTPQPVAEDPPPLQVEPEPSTELPRASRFDGERAGALALQIVARSEVDERMKHQVLEAMRTRANGPQTAKAVFSALSRSADNTSSVIRWGVVEEELRDFLQICFEGKDVELIAPRRGDPFDPRTMNDYSQSLTGSRSKVARLLAPGYRSGDVTFRAATETG